MPEVDLTEDKGYSNLTTMPRSATNILPEIFRESSIPWNFSTPYTLPRIVHSDAELGQVPLVFTGDAETINFMREVAEVEEGKRCDCCGKLITTPQWDMPAGSLFVLSAHSAWKRPFMANKKRPGRKSSSRSRSDSFLGGMTCNLSFTCTSLRTE